MLLCPWIKRQFGDQRIDVAGIGGFVIVALVLGHFLHGLGHLTVEPVMRSLGWVSDTERTLDQSQFEMYAQIAVEKRGRIDTFNRIYGLQLGLSMAFLLILLICAVFTTASQRFGDNYLQSVPILKNRVGMIGLAIGLLLAFGISLYRMNEFSGLYQRDLKATFQALSG